MSRPSFIEKGKKSIHILLPIFMVCGFILFLPDTYKQALHIDNLTYPYAQYLGISFLILGVLIFIDVSFKISQSIIRKRRKSKMGGYIIEYLSQLSIDEKSILREFYLAGDEIQLLPYNHPIVLGLLSKGIIMEIGSYEDMRYGQVCFSYTITEYARKYITNQTLNIPFKMTQKDFERLSNERPFWL
ncbi:Superinfection exclusion protein B [Pedobacter westerhofensis]|uniref:Superinfection exclusion protein B n=1 Tax=Pedobacter westerhofensis TaxID=425512 RepID=A0A521FTZ4_9SPHI|nr:super-infection exclusion protein B [Pedobacter westerhofensis]SMO99628.1 Superinfection exclusion protein B [Pedobacter westerhofensis]